MPTKYRIDRYDQAITEVTIVAETAHFVTIRHNGWHNGKPYERREKKDGSIFDTWAEAKKMLILLRRGELASAESRVESARSKLADAEALTQETKKKK